MPPFALTYLPKARSASWLPWNRPGATDAPTSAITSIVILSAVTPTSVAFGVSFEQSIPGVPGARGGGGGRGVRRLGAGIVGPVAACAREQRGDDGEGGQQCCSFQRFSRDVASVLSSMAMSMIWSSWPPTSRRSPQRSRISAAGDAVALGRAVGVAEEARVHAGVAHDQAHAVERALAVHDGPHDLFGDVEDHERVDARADPEPVEHGRQRFGRGVARARAERPGAAVDLDRSGADRKDGVGHPEREVLVPVEPDLRVVAELGDERRHAVADLVEDQRAGGVDDVDALASGVGHHARLRREELRRLRVAHHQEADRLEAELPRDGEVLARDVGLRAVRRDPHHGHADVAARRGCRPSSRRRAA